ncbi:amylovoran biosynthesis protein AmsE [Escherichia coli]|uniref:glycosyltransferase n=1 Tax=Escherichia coli TaxID=562 RepID=UPI00092ACC29|nr:glycosyltransferase [Escherichia coli]OJK49703.1 amylovoran biosynthesis protein AmsE [Escherichia coli]
MNSFDEFNVLLSLYKNESPDNLDACFQSISTQSLKRFKIILVIDGPISSELNEVVGKWKSLLPIKIINLERNVGLGNALNIGLKYCSCDYVFRMDKDDICHPDRFSIQFSYLRKHPDIDLLGGQIVEFHECIEEPNGMRLVPSKYEEILQYCKLKNPFNHMTVVFKRESVLKVGGYKHHLYMEDYNLWLRMISIGCKVENLDDVIVFARTDVNSLMRRRGWQYVKSEWKLALLKIKLRINNPIVSLSVFILRSIPRLLPIMLIRRIYAHNRK